MKLVFDVPAENMTETLPVGNGRLGAMIYGELMREQVVLNESSVWSGSPEEADREDAVNFLPEIRRLLSEGKNYEAEQIFDRYFVCKGKGSNYAHGSTVPFGCYQILGRMHLSYFQALSDGRVSCDCVKDYRRSLDLMTGEAVVSFTLDGVSYRREWIASEEKDAIYLHLTASQPGMIHAGIGLDRDEHFVTERLNDSSIFMRGRLSDGYGRTGGIRYFCAAGAKSVGGTVFTEGNRIYIQNADEVLIAITAQTDMSGFMGKRVLDRKLKDVLEGNWKELRTLHCQNMQAVMGRMEITFNGTGREEISTPERIRRFCGGEKDEELLALYVQYARYLLHCCSRKGGLPANLQGIWADEIQTPWNGDWHLNAQQMIYWMAEKGNLSENHLPYLELAQYLSIPGSRTARSYYGAGGWTVHTCTNPWGFTSPCEEASWGSTPGGSAWLCHHLWEHYLYTCDREYLTWAYPIMKGAAQFYLDMLVEDSEYGWLVTSPSSSPENVFLDRHGRSCFLCEGSAYERALVFSLFESCIEAQYVLKNDADFSEILQGYLERLAPIQITSDKRIMEWGKEYREKMPYHRHLSHLWGVYPGQMISEEHTPEYAEAAGNSLKARGRSTVGWAIAHRMCLWSRLRNGEEAFACVRDMFQYATGSNLFNLAYHCDETVREPEMPDLKHCRYPFQIDGNQGNAIGILMMLEDDFAHVQPDGKMEIEVILLPALPQALPQGRVKGVCTKGGLCVDLEWSEGKLQKTVFHGRKGQIFSVWYNEKKYMLNMKSARMEWKVPDE